MSEVEPTIPFGKYKGVGISEIEIEYLDWLIGQDWFVENFAKLHGQIIDYLRGCPEWQRM